MAHFGHDSSSSSSLSQRDARETASGLELVDVVHRDEGAAAAADYDNLNGTAVEPSLPIPDSTTTTATTTATTTTTPISSSSRGVLQLRRNFVHTSLLVATVPATALACLALAADQLGHVTGDVQSGVLYVSYTAASILGVATFTVKQYGARAALCGGLTLLCAYVGCFVGALQQTTTSDRQAWAWTGAALGGMGAGILWTAQGTYLAQAALVYATAQRQEHPENNNHHHHNSWPPGREPSTRSTSSSSSRNNNDDDDNDDNNADNGQVEQATNTLAGIFAFCFLALETTLDVLSTVLTKAGCPWRLVFGVYATAALSATVALPLVAYDYQPGAHDDDATHGPCDKATAALRLLRDDVRIKYLWGMNAAFGLSGAFLNSFVNAEVVPLVLQTDDDVGLLVALHGGTAAACALLFASWSSSSTTTTTICGSRKFIILSMGACGYMAVALPFLWQPDLGQWTWWGVVGVYMAQGVGRATFEGTFRALFVDYFGYEKEGAFANLILQNGLSSAVGFLLSMRLPCTARTPSSYCMEYHDGTRHDLLSFGMIVVVTSILAVAGLYRAAILTNHGVQSFVSTRRPYQVVARQQSTISNGEGEEEMEENVTLPAIT